VWVWRHNPAPEDPEEMVKPMFQPWNPAVSCAYAPIGR
jgi:hypothetical protein